MKDFIVGLLIIIVFGFTLYLGFQNIWTWGY